jgi:translation initiation factor 2 subunit 1
MMLYRRHGFPEEGEVVLCTVTKINPNSVFVNLNEYDKSGMIHISEISPGRIRNIRDYVLEGKVIVCKILGVNQEKGYIDLSLRRVNEALRRNKLEQIKLEQKAEKIIELAAQTLKKDTKEIYNLIAKPILENYLYVYEAFTEVAQDKIKIEDLYVPKEYSKELEELIRKRFKVEKIPVEGILKIQTYADDGIELIKKLLKEVEKTPNSTVMYLGAGAYKIRVDSEDVKKDEKMLDKKIEELIAEVEKANGTATFVKEAAEQ